MDKVQDIMTRDPKGCTSDTSLEKVAKLMVEYDCGEIPVIDSVKDSHLVGVITDRDIVCRTLGKGLNPMDMKVSEVMTFPVITVSQFATLDHCRELMEKRQIRRIPVVDDFDKMTGIVSLADIVRAQEPIVGEIVREISKPKSASIH